MQDSYKTIAKRSGALYKEKGSKFIGIAFPAINEDEFKATLDAIKSEYHDARHHCYAFKFGMDDNNYRYNDDGEPSNSAGAPIYGQIQSFELTNIGIVVVRYFGGTKLGVGGLIGAYRQAAKEALENAQLVSKTISDYYRLTFNYAIMGDVMTFLKQEQIEITEQLHGEHGELIIRVRKRDIDQTLGKLDAVHGLKVEFIETI